MYTDHTHYPSSTTGATMARPLPIQVPGRRRTISLGGLQQFCDTLGTPSQVSPTSSTRLSATPLSPNPILPVASPPLARGEGGLSSMLRRASWFEGSGTQVNHTVGVPVMSTSGQHLFNSLPSRMQHPNVFGKAGEEHVAAPPLKSPPPSHPRVSVLSTFGGEHVNKQQNVPQRPATPMGNMILSGQFLD
jgi:hypothetical protein